MSFRINEDGLQRYYDAGGDLEAWLDATLAEIERVAVGEAPVKSGALAGSHEQIVEVVGGQVRARLVNRAEYSRFVHDGTAAHEIEGNPLLRFADSSGRIVYARRVSHPGTEANPWMLRALERVLS